MTDHAREPKKTNGGPREVTSTLHVLVRSLRLIAGAAPGAAAGYVLLVGALSLSPVFQVWLTRLVFDALGAGDRPRALILGSVNVLMLVLPATCEPARELLRSWLEDRAVAEVDRQLIDAGSRLTDLGLVERPIFRDDLLLASQSVYYVANLLRSLQHVSSGLLSLSGILLLLGRLHPLVPLALFLVTIPYLMAERNSIKLTYRAMGESSPAAREMDYCVQAATQAALAKEIRVFGLGTFFLDRYRRSWQVALREMQRVRLSHLRTTIVFGFLYALVLASGFWYVATTVQSGRLTTGDIALYLSAILQAVTLLAATIMWFGQPYQALQYLRSLFKFLDDAKPTIRLSLPELDGVSFQRVEQGVELRSISFTYPEGASSVFEGLETTLAAGKMTAVVGANGAGKSTLVKLLTRMYDPVSGVILIDGLALYRYDLHSLRSRIATVFQDFARFSLTLRENIEIGSVSLMPSDERLETAARLAEVDLIAAKLPRRYDTELTRRFAGGVELSGGEWQKVAIARTLMREASVVVLDEPTAALDADAEHIFLSQLHKIAENKTVLLISHRLSAVRLADSIIVLDEGRVVESGSHDELIQHSGRYAALFEMQASRYR